MTQLPSQIPSGQDPQLTALHNRLQNDLEYYCRRTLKIKPKIGPLEPFIFNTAQIYLHERVEAQKKRLGRVRVLIVKGRQQGCCYSPEMRVLTADYRWVKLKDLPVGSRLMAVDENLGELNKAGRKCERRILTSIVEAKVILKKPIFNVTLSNGTVLEVTGEHRHLCRKRGADDVQWRAVKDTKVGDFIRVLSQPPDKMPMDFEDGWFSGLLDGEGSFGASPQVRISLSQVQGAVLERAKKYLQTHKINFYELIDRRLKVGKYSKLGDKPVHCLRIDRITDVLKLLCRTRPSRFISRELFVGKKLPTTAPGFDAWTRVVSIEYLKTDEVIDLQTDKKTYVCEGIVSHNSTYVAARYYHRATRNEGQSVFILSHESQTTEKLYSIVERYHENAPDVARPAAEVQNRRQLKFEKLGSDYSVGTAGNQNVGRGGTLQLFHGSEVAFWENTDQIQTGILQSIPDLPDTEIILESTANGMSNMFYDLVKEAEDKKNDYEVVFIPWYWQPEYRRQMPADNVWELTAEEEEYRILYSQSPYKKIVLDKEQIYWMRAKISEFRGNKWKFYQEYPAYLQQAFQTSGDSLISAEAVIRARKIMLEEADTFAPLIIGVDPGRTRDRSVFVWRRGRKIIKYLVFRFDKSNKENITMVLAGKLASIIQSDNPDGVIVDVGDGTGVVDRLRELGYTDIVHGVYASEEPIDEQHLNKRSEMWCLMRDWFHGEEGPVSCPDDDVFQRDICAMPDSFKSSSGKTQLRSNEIIRQKTKMSLDIGSAAAHTFAYQIRRRDDNIQQSRIRAKHPGKSALKTLQKQRKQNTL